WISSLVKDYYKVDGKDLGERNPKGLQDDYVKFIRFAQWRIDKSGQGILAFISNHGFLDNPTFRGMRQHLINSFDGIYIYDLHGNSKKKETDIDGGKDENVFDIQQGVSITLAIKGEDKYINHAHLFGLREYKYKVLLESAINNTFFKKIESEGEFYLFISQDNNFLKEYKNYYKIIDIMPFSSTGIKTHRDNFVIDFDIEKLLKRIVDFRNLEISDEELKEMYSLKDTRDWKISQSRISLSKNMKWKTYFNKCLYRPFDWREYYNHEDVVELPRHEIMRNMLESNLCLLTNRQIRINEVRHTWVGNTPVDFHIIDTAYASIYVFPLFIYEISGQEQLIKSTKYPNFSEDFLKKIEINLGYLPTPETIFYYIYAIFHSPTYRSRYAEFLKIDFPRVPLTSNNELFCQLAEYGEELVALHLMKSPKLNNLITQYTENGGSQIVDAGHPKYTKGAVVINKKGDKFVGVPEQVWNFYIGGYQVCQKWLKDRKGRSLNDDDIQHYQRVVVALKETMELMQLIDDVIPDWPIS
ncbi:MAG: hypothetical protein RLZZ86_1263, partial [Cyanobacteriota bacterium]